MEQVRQTDVNLEAVRASARLNAPDHYYAALFAPSAVRDDLIALAAFVGEIKHVGRLASDAALGEIRIAWWRDALLEGQGATGNPVLDAFAETLRRHGLPRSDIAEFLSAEAQSLYPDPPIDDAALDARLHAIDAVPFALAARILGLEIDETANVIFDAAGRASGMARIARTLPYTLMRGRSTLPADRSPNPFESPQDWRPQIAWLKAEAAEASRIVRRHIAAKPRAFLTALLPLALVEPYFRALQSPRHDPTRDLIEIAPLARLWRIARAHWTGRL